MRGFRLPAHAAAEERPGSAGLPAVQRSFSIAYYEDTTDMFIEAIERAAEFTRPIHTIVRYHGSTEVHPGAATLFLVNADGWALTCKHVAEQFRGAEQIGARNQAYKAERAAIPAKHRRHRERELERKYGLGRDQVADAKLTFVNCPEGASGVDVKAHPTLDIALLKFRDFTNLRCTTFPVFGKDGGHLKQGMLLCRLGFPFAEFSNFAYDAATDSIGWTDQGRKDTPRFPIDGMVTRHVGTAIDQITGFELSTPGLRGQSGGPAFDAEGRVWGMQSVTQHLDLDFDVDLNVVRRGTRKRIMESAVLHAGRCVHVDALKTFMREHEVNFSEG
jgi:hypothetical protein